MTRINLVDPTELTDKHLNAERREIRMHTQNLQRTLNSRNGFVEKKVPPSFTLNSGHCYFFYNKGEYLHKRFNQLTEEMKKRGFKPDETLQFRRDLWPDELYNDWTPSELDKNIVRDRIALRISQKPDGWYKKTEHIT